jgi:hypothetical protein
MPHAIMQVYRGAYGGAQVKNGNYGNQEFFHIPVKVERFSGMVFIKFGKKLVSGLFELVHSLPDKATVHSLPTPSE